VLIFFNKLVHERLKKAKKLTRRRKEGKFYLFSSEKDDDTRRKNAFLFCDGNKKKETHARQRHKNFLLPSHSLREKI